MSCPTLRRSACTGVREAREELARLTEERGLVVDPLSRSSLLATWAVLRRRPMEKATHVMVRLIVGLLTEPESAGVCVKRPEECEA